MTTFWSLLFRPNEINDLANVKSSTVVIFAKNVVIFGLFLTTRVVKTSGGVSSGKNRMAKPLSGTPVHSKQTSRY
jgi:hypothetical protein